MGPLQWGLNDQIVTHSGTEIQPGSNVHVRGVWKGIIVTILHSPLSVVLQSAITIGSPLFYLNVYFNLIALYYTIIDFNEVHIRIYREYHF